MDSNIAFDSNQMQMINQMQQPAAQGFGGGGWDDDEPKKPKNKLLNGRYRKIKKLGQGAFNTVYLAEDLYPLGQNRVLSKDQLELISKIPDCELNPYRKASYFMDDEEQQEMDPALREQLQIDNNFMPKNDQFENEKKDDENEKAVQESKSASNLVAIKKQRNISSLDGLEFTLLREIKLLQELNHVNIVKLYDVFHIKNLLYYALEFGPIDLEQLMFKYTDQKQFGQQADHDPIVLDQKHIKCIMKMIFEGLGYLHSNWIMHRDLKPGNMIIDKGGIIKIIDFNSAKIYGSPNKKHSKQATTIHYRSPEQLFSSKFYGPSTDIWSAGCIFGELYLRTHMFPGEGQIDQLGKIFAIRGTPSQQNWQEAKKLPDYMEFTKTDTKEMSDLFPMMSSEGHKLIDWCLQLDPNLRPSAQEALQHKYFKEEPVACDASELPIQHLMSN